MIRKELKLEKDENEPYQSSPCRSGALAQHPTKGRQPALIEQGHRLELRLLT